MTGTMRVALAILSTVVAVAAASYWLDVFDVTDGDVAELLSRLRWWCLPVICALLAAHVALAAVRWGRIEVALGGSRPQFGRAYLTGALALALGTFLPGPVANVSCRGLCNRLTGASGIRGAVGGGLDQIADIAVVLLFALPAVIGFITRSATVYAGGAALTAILGWAIAERLSRDEQGPVIGRLTSKFPKLAPFVGQGLAGELYLLTLARFANLSAITLMIHLASGAASAGSVLVAVPLVTLAISMAMLPGGFGVAEWSFTGVLAQFSVPASEIMMFVLANRLVLTALGLLIGALAAAYAVLSIGNRRANAC